MSQTTSGPAAPVTPAVPPVAPAAPGPAPLPTPPAATNQLQPVTQRQLASLLSRPASVPPEPATAQHPAGPAPAPAPSVPSHSPDQLPPTAPAPEPAPAEPASPAPAPAADPEPAPPQETALERELREAIAEAKASGNNATAGLLKRIGKLTAKLHAAESQVAAAPAAQPAASAPAAQPAATPPPAPPDPIAQAQAQLDSAMQILQWAEANAQGGSFQDQQGRTVEFTPDQMARHRATALATISTASAQIETRRLHQQTTAEAQLSAQREAARNRAFELVPELTDPDSPETAQALQILAENPELAQSPRAAVLAAEILLARRGQGVRPQPPVRPQPAVRRATPAPGAPSAGAAAQDPQQAVDQAYEEARRSGSVRNFAKLLSATRAPRVA